jgi:hypothetical protein
MAGGIKEEKFFSQLLELLLWTLLKANSLK